MNMLEEDEELDDDYDEEELDEPLVPCPYCGVEMLEESPQCPSCGNYISAEDLPTTSQPTWVILTAVVCLLLALGWVFSGL
jgi:hypothetical protein